MPTGEAMQRHYYEETAAVYDDLHESEIEHTIALQYMLTIMTGLGIRSVLDVGSGTGRVSAFLARHDPSLNVLGLEPVMALIRQAVKQKGIPRRSLVNGVGERLPFRDASFDAVVETATLHHTPHPEYLISEMKRVSRKAIFLSDKNRFAYGGSFGRLARLALWKAGLWSVAYRIKTRGKGFTVGKRDGVVYSYSVFDSYDQLVDWADRIILVPLGPITGKSVFHPLFTSGNVLLCALRDTDTVSGEDSFR